LKFSDKYSWHSIFLMWSQRIYMSLMSNSSPILLLHYIWIYTLFRFSDKTSGILFSQCNFYFRLVSIVCVYSQIFKTPGCYHWFIPTVTHFLMLKLFHYICYWLLWFFSLTVRLFHSSVQILSFYGRCDLIVTLVALLLTLPSYLHPLFSISIYDYGLNF